MKLIMITHIIIIGVPVLLCTCAVVCVPTLSQMATLVFPNLYVCKHGCEASSYDIVAIIIILQQKRALLHVSTTHGRTMNIFKIITCVFITAPLPISFLCSCSYIFMSHYPLYRQMRGIIGSLTKRGCSYNIVAIIIILQRKKRPYCM